MNLWVKRTGQLLVVALLLVSCEDDSFLLGFKNQNKKFQGLYKEITLANNVVFADSIPYTDNLAGSRLLIGKYNDPILGSAEASGFTEIRPSSATKLDASSVYDSITFEMSIDFYSYGLSDEHVEKFTIHRITEDTLSYYSNPNSKVFGSKRYKANSVIGFDPTPLGTASIKVNYDSLKKNLQKTSGYDTILVKAKLDDAFGQELFDVSLINPDSILNKLAKFRWQFKGLAFMADASSSAVLGYSPSSALSKIILHYHTTESGSVKDTLQRAFNMVGINFNNITTIRAGGYPSSDFPFESTNPAYLAIQGGNTILSKIDITPFHDFVNTIGANVVFNSAELLFESTNSLEGVSKVNAFELRISKADNHFYEYKIDDDSLFFRNYLKYSSNGLLFNEPIFTNGYYLANSDFLTSQPIAASLLYNSSNNQYTGYLTRFFQGLYDKRDLEEVNKIKHLTVYPATAATGLNSVSLGKTLDRTILNKEVKLRLYYTLPNSSNF